MGQLKNFWTSTDIQRLYRMNDRVKSKQTLLNAEKRGEIPSAVRIARGKVNVRTWSIDQLPAIGEKFGFLKKPKKQIIICIFTPKGGVLKSSFAWGLGRSLALNGSNTAIVGLDSQCSFTDIAFPPRDIENLDDYDPKEEFLGLYHFLYDNVPLEQIIKKTDIPTLDVLPETHELVGLEKKLRTEVRSEYIIKERLIPRLSNYDVIIFDNGPSWNLLIENSLVASKVVISPLGCDFLAYRAASKNLNQIISFGGAAKAEWDHFIIIPTLLEKNKLSQQIYGAYLNEYGEYIAPHPIRRAVKGQESLLLGKGPLEYEMKSSLSQDYFELLQFVWKKITD